jgi:hypothetical protein
LLPRVLSYARPHAAHVAVGNGAAFGLDSAAQATEQNRAPLPKMNPPHLSHDAAFRLVLAFRHSCEQNARRCRRESDRAIGLPQAPHGFSFLSRFLISPPTCARHLTEQNLPPPRARSDGGA